MKLLINLLLLELLGVGVVLGDCLDFLDGAMLNPLIPEQISVFSQELKSDH